VGESKVMGTIFGDQNLEWLDQGRLTRQRMGQ